jgi:hypothetical protein
VACGDRLRTFGRRSAQRPTAPPRTRNLKFGIWLPDASTRRGQEGSTMTVEPVTEAIVRRAAVLADAGLHSRQHAVDAMPGATALAAHAPVIKV